MDICKPEQRLPKLAAADTTRSPLVSAEKNNGTLTTRRPRTREVSSRPKSPTPSTSSGRRRCQSPNPTRTTPTPAQAVEKRAVSAERKRPSTPSSPHSTSTPVHDSSTPSGLRRCQSPTPTRTTPTPVQAVEKRAVSAERKRPSTPSSPHSTSTPVHDSSTAVSISSRRLSTSRIPEGLWPSTMRSPSVSFQADTISIPVSKKEKEKLVSNVSLDRSLRPPSDVAHRQQSETSTLSEKPNPERKRSLLEGKIAPDQSENVKLVGVFPSQLIDHHRWPSRIGGRLSSHSMSKSVDLGDTTVNNLSTPNPEIVSSLKRMPISDSSGIPLPKSSNDAARLISLDDIGRTGSEATSIGDNPRRASFPANILSASSLEKTTLTSSGSRPQSPSRSSVSRGVSALQARPSTPTPRGVSPTPRGVSPTPRVVSPTRMRTSTSSSQSHSSTSRGVSPTPRVASPTRTRTSTSSSQSHNSTPILSPTPRGVSPTPRGVSPTRMRTSTSSSQSHSSTSVLDRTSTVVDSTRLKTSIPSSISHSSTSVLNSKTRVVSPTRMRTSTSSTRTHSRSYSSTSILSSTLRGVSPTPRAVSPSRARTSTSSSESHSSTSVLSFILDFTKERKSASQIEDAHQLCLLYNRYLQWRFANAHAETVLYIQKVNAEKTLYNVWNPTLSLCDTLIKKKINLQQLKLELNLNYVLNHQMGYLNDWELLERDHIRSLAGAEEDLKASTLNLPITSGARADIESLKAAICSAVDVMHAMGSSICSLLLKVQGASSCVSELAAIAEQEKNMLAQCESLLSSTATMQLEECSFRSHLMQTKQHLKKNNKQPSMAAKTCP